MLPHFILVHEEDGSEAVICIDEIVEVYIHNGKSCIVLQEEDGLSGKDHYCGIIETPAEIYEMIEEKRRTEEQSIRKLLDEKGW